jgi:hypothetical protein
LWNRPLAAVVAFAFALKLGLLAVTQGTNDVDAWRGFVEAYRAHGPFAAYGVVGAALNHPLLGFLAVTASANLGRALHLFHDAFWLRIPALAGDAITIAVLGPLLSDRFGVKQARWLVAFYALSPIVLLAGLFHGNTDVLWGAGVLAATLALERERPATAGLLLAAASSVKVAAVPMLVPLALTAARRKMSARLYAGWLAGMVALFGPCLLFGGSPFVEFVLGYRGCMTGHPWPQLLEHVLPESLWARYQENSGPLIIAIMSVMAAVLSRRGAKPGEAVAASMGIILLLVPCFGPQYLVWFALPVMLLGLRSAAPYHLLAAIQAGSLYARWGGARWPYHADCTAVRWTAERWHAVLTWSCIAVSVLVVFARRLGSTRQGSGATSKEPVVTSRNRTSTPDVVKRPSNEDAASVLHFGRRAEGD